ncbi:MFS-type transporter SLC18B1 [Strongyloides ratti]|uniref:MFS-type transporter SLC18B1 n=1 Tax=Strongyloides ratti TaxID=34506 RepID=A0A090LUR8_STRRB|nr:MFS-type transporter SLC18B1 [Strongyloides ratti]CEF71374.1 MFS-type transporter SLC18B1 [Strongyloides ratti]
MENNKINNKSLKTFNLSDWITFAILILSNFLSPVIYTCIFPFFNDIALIKNVSFICVGIIFGIFNFGSFILSPIIGRVIAIFGSRKIFIIGICLLSLGTILFSPVYLIKNKHYFFGICLFLRFIQSVGKTMIYTTTYVIASKNFLHHMSTILGCVEFGAGFGYTIGPFIGGFLYQYFGFYYIFLFLGFLSIIIGIFSFLYINLDDNKLKNVIRDKNHVCESEKNYSWKKIIKIKDIWCLIYTIFFVGITSSFQDSSIPIGLKQFHFNSTKVGLMYIFFGGTYTIFSPISGFISDKYSVANFLIIFGYFLQTIVFLLLGSTSFFNYNPTEILYIICLLFMGFSSSIIYVPSFKKTITILKNEHKFLYNFKILSIVSGIFCSSYSLGALLGPIIGSLLINNYGYHSTIVIFSIISFISMILFIILYIIPRIIKKIRKN